MVFLAKKKPTQIEWAKTIQGGYSQTVSTAGYRPKNKLVSGCGRLESVHLVELNKGKLVVTDGFSNKLFHL
ncbi:MAG: hypothetical protein ACRC8Q_12870 [Aeromonas sp.]